MQDMGKRMQKDMSKMSGVLQKLKTRAATTNSQLKMLGDEKYLQKIIKSNAKTSGGAKLKQFPSKILSKTASMFNKPKKSEKNGGRIGVMSKLNPKGSSTKARKKNSVFSNVIGKRLAIMKKSLEMSYRRGIGRFINKVKTALKKTLSAVKSIIKGVYKLAKGAYKGVKIGAKVAFKGAKLFFKAAKVAGKTGITNMKSIVKTSIKTGKTKGRNITKAGNQFSGAKLVNVKLKKFGKWAAKKIWLGIKKLARSIFNQITKLFNWKPKFKNKPAFFSSKLKKGVDKEYKFLVNPISGIVVTLMGFMIGIVKVHI